LSGSIDSGEFIEGGLRTVGLPVAEDRLSEMVQADVLISEEGQARAIRFVNFQR